MTITGTAAGVPFVALPPENTDGPAPLVVVWHLLDAPRSPAAMAAAVPMAGVRAWRVYWGMPMFGARTAMPMEELFRLAAEDYVLNIAKPIVDQAVAEFPAALAELRAQLSIADGPIGVAGGSMGGLVAYEVAATVDVPVAAVALVNPVTRLAPVVEAAVREFSGGEYAWSDESRATADHYDFLRRKDEIKVPTLLVVGAEDGAEFREPAADLGDRVTLVTIPGMKHPIADEPGVEAAPQNADGERVDAEFTKWFQRYL
ncbi:alpha/beta hydrolase family protein [Actinocrispum wychmicini]|uniref:Prolyl oligopeptidase family protein n=1 Tax=Actinocrispum wychmicini TaxID=1213861 RepID=A0A4R2J4E9_9PSEU|nr:alpha/beta hydrolase [Actinocrispum wychmicini]TCO53024.1 hypothetical protein EV192_111221 [Actinocrispum wychmicini]